MRYNLAIATKILTMKKTFFDLGVKAIGLLVSFAPVTALAADIGDVKAPNPLKGVTSLFGEDGLVWKILEWAIVLAGVMAVVYIIVGGYQYMTGGDEGVKKGRGTITAAIVGLVIVLISFVIVNTIQGDILGAKSLQGGSSGGLFSIF